MSVFEHGGLRFHVRDEGHGQPFLFQHGLGGDVNRPFGLYRPLAGIRLIAFDISGHAETRPLGDINKLTIETLADDLVALMDHQRLVADSPCPLPARYGNLNVPTLILGNRRDLIHPWALAGSLSRMIPGAEPRAVTPKSVSLEQLSAEDQQAIDDFLTRHFQTSR
jgi:pimeloyl-ACP methyl ester carboxylesterase